MMQSEWYRQALKDAVVLRGNNFRLKKVIERARSGEQITLAVIGGSITEGEGAASYPECWASLFRDRFGEAFGTAGGSRVHLVNAGVGGTPSPFGYMRYGRDVLRRVPDQDADGLPDLVVVEFAVNDWRDPTGSRCYESMVKDILDAPNAPAVLLLFSVFQDGSNLQDRLAPVGSRYDLMMVSIRDGIYPHVGKELTEQEFFFDRCHPTSLGHSIMADCLMAAVLDSAAAPADPAPALNVPPVYGTDFIGLKTVFGDRDTGGFLVDRGGFPGSDTGSYRNIPVGWVCGANFFHDSGDPMLPLKVSGVFRKCLVAWKASPDPAFGAADVLVDGRCVMTLRGAADKWGQSEVVLALDDSSPESHTLEIRPAEEGKRFTVTAIGFQ